MAAGFYACATETIHEIPDREALADDLGRVLLAPRVDHYYALGYEDCSQRYVGGDGHIPRLRVLGDVAVRDVGPTVYAHCRQVRVAWWDLETLICHEDGLESEALGSAITHLLHLARGGIGIEPELHGTVSTDGRQQRVGSGKTVAPPCGGAQAEAVTCANAIIAWG